MHVAFLLKKYPKPSETFITNQIRGLNDLGHTIDVYVQRNMLTAGETVPGNARDVMYFDPINIKDKLVSVFRTQVPATFCHPFYMFKLIKHGTNAVTQNDLWKWRSAPLLQRLDEYDAIHAHYGPVGNAFQFINKKTQAPFITSFYGYDVSKLLKKNPWRYENLFECVDVVLSLSRYMDEQLIAHGCPFEKLVRFPLPVDTDSFQYEPLPGESVETIDLLSVCRLVEKKGITYVLDALETLRDDYTIQYRIAGDGPLREKLERQVFDAKLEDQVFFEGWKSSDEVAQLMSESDIFIQTSVTSSEGDKEGTPTVLLEAQARGMPVISTYHAGIPEIVDDGMSGILVPERDSVAIAYAIKKLVSDPSKWSKYGRNGREFIEKRHSLKAVASRLEHIYTNAR